MSPPPSGGAGTKPRFYGKYRGAVIDNIDPMQIGRVQAQVPDALGEVPSSWALPSVPAAGIQAGCFIVPPIGAQVWIEFERGDPDYPIWTGGFWGAAPDVPALAISPPPIPPGQTIGQNTLALSDAPPSPNSGGIILAAAGGATIVVNDAGIATARARRLPSLGQSSRSIPAR
jgi:uncharacterized protein involved in type VI secretion and phage assembly